jgi:hypothetical protein
MFTIDGTTADPNQLYPKNEGRKSADSNYFPAVAELAVLGTRSMTMHK